MHGLPSVTEARASYEASAAGSSRRHGEQPGNGSGMRRSGDGNPVDIEDDPRKEHSKLTNEPDAVEEEIEYDDEYYDEEEDDDELVTSKASKGSKGSRGKRLSGSAKLSDKAKAFKK